MGGAVAVVLVGVVIAALGAEEQGGQHEQPAAGQQHGGEGEAGGVHGATDVGCSSILVWVLKPDGGLCFDLDRRMLSRNQPC